MTDAIEIDDLKFKPHRSHKTPANLKHFWVIAVVSNPKMYHRRYELTHRFIKMVKESGVNLIVVEQAFGGRQYMVTNPNNPHHVQVRGDAELFLKECMINRGIQRAREIDPLAAEVMWCDADCAPMTSMREWFEQIWHSLQHYEIVQCWQWLLNLGPNDEPLTGKPEESFMSTYAKYGYQVPPHKQKRAPKYYYDFSKFGHTGLAWAANIDMLVKIGLLLDVCICGASDWHMAHAFLGMCKDWSGEFDDLPPYKQFILDYEKRCEHYLKRDVGLVPMTMYHWWHGKFKDRAYGTRGRILVDNQFNPYTDLKRDADGMWQFEVIEPRHIRMRDQMRDLYFGRRNEDSIDK